MRGDAAAADGGVAAAGRVGPAVLALLAFIEATIFPAPTEALLVALAIARPRPSWWLGALAAGASALGGLAGYWIGAAAFDGIGRPVLTSLGLIDHLAAAAVVYRENAFLALATSGYTPIPYLLYTMAAGAFDIPLATFVAGSIVGRGLKYLPILLLVRLIGPRVRPVLERHARVATALFVAVVLLWIVFQGTR